MRGIETSRFILFAKIHFRKAPVLANRPPPAAERGHSRPPAAFVVPGNADKNVGAPLPSRASEINFGNRSSRLQAGRQYLGCPAFNSAAG